ncbi:MAG: AraC family ligand binding domain-containing protein [Kiritimatiellia bacterium]
MPDSAEPSFFSAQISHARRFYLDLKPSPRGPLTVVSGGVEQCSPDYEINRRGFPFLSVEFVARGRGEVRIGGREHPLTAGCLFTYGPRVAHRITTDPRNRMVKYFVDFTGAPGLRLLEQTALRPGVFAQVSRPNEVCEIFDTLIANGLQGSRFSKPICATLLTYLLFKIAETALPGGAGKAGAFDTYQRCRQHIAGHYLAVSSQEEIAAACHVDTAYLCRLFQRFDHQTLPDAHAPEDEPRGRPPAALRHAGQAGRGRAGLRRRLPFFAHLQARAEHLAESLPERPRPPWQSDGPGDATEKR